MPKAFCLTINNPSLEEKLQFSNELFSYSIYQTERGDSGTLHIQGYVYCQRIVRIISIKKLFPRAHIEIARGTIEENISYCSKEETRIEGPFEHGTKPISSKGARNDIEYFRDAIREGKSDEDLLNLFPNMVAKYQKFIYFVRCSMVPRRSEKPSVRVYHGRSGTGKTRTAVGDNPGDCYIVSRPDSNRPLWWDGYQGQPTVVIDDFYGWIPWSYILQLLDRYPFMVEIKGGKVNFNSKDIYITSNTTPENWYKNIPNNDLTPLLRRIDEIKKFE